MTPRKRVPASHTTNFAPTVQQRTNALIASALRAKQRAKQEKPSIDWDAMIARLHAMLDNLED